MYLIENIIKVFMFDTFICSINNLCLSNYMKNKHKWNKEQFEEYLELYKLSFME